MSKRAFEVRRHDRREFLTIKCGKCGFEAEKQRPSMMNARVANEGRVVSRWFESEGWVVGLRHQDDRCPDCATSADRLRKKYRVVETRTLAEQVFAPKPVAIVPPAPPAVQKPKVDRTAVLALVLEVRSKLDEIEKLLA